MSKILKHAVWIALAGCLLLLVVSLAMAWATRGSAFPLGDKSVQHPTMVAVELPESAEELGGLLQIGGQWTRPIVARLRASMTWDNYFPLVYSLCFLTIVVFVLGSQRQQSSWALAAGAGGAIAIVITIVFDYRENTYLLALLDKASPGADVQIAQLTPLISSMSHASLLKWGCLGISLALLGLAEVLMQPRGVPFAPANALRILSAFSGGIFGMWAWVQHARGLVDLELNAFAIVALTTLVQSIVLIRSRRQIIR